jgi:lysophospholipase L1-like esterase
MKIASPGLNFAWLSPRLCAVAVSSLLMQCLMASADSPPASSPATLPATAPATQPADIPAPKLEADGQISTGFLKMHESFLARRDQPMDVLFLGDSLTDFWRRPAPNGGEEIWNQYYQPLHAANFGISGDRTQHILWRIQQGELDGIHPKLLILLIGTNNLAYPLNEIESGQKKIIEQIHEKLPGTKLLILGLFPRGTDPKSTALDPKIGLTAAQMREKIRQDNLFLATFDDGGATRFLDFGGKFLDADGKIPPHLMPDGLHPDAPGYQIWADAMQPLLQEMLK